MVAIVSARKVCAREKNQNHNIRQNLVPTSLRTGNVSILLPLSPIVRHDVSYIMRSGYDAECARQDIEFFAMQRQNLSIDHHIHRGIQIELDAGNGLAFGEEMLDVGAVV